MLYYSATGSLRTLAQSVARGVDSVDGMRARVHHEGAGVLAGLPSPLWVMRYHSLVATRVPARFEVTARDDVGQVMALRDAEARIEAVQFHPESIGTAGGMRVLASALGQIWLGVERRGAVPPPDAAGPEHREALYR